MKDDPRFQTQFLNDDQKFEMFKEHMKELFNLKRKDFRDLLDENQSMINPHTSYETLKDALKEDERFKDFPERSRIQSFEQHKEWLQTKVKKDFSLMMTDSLTKMLIQRLIKDDEEGKSTKQLFEDVTEMLEERDERYVKMGIYFREERDQTMLEEVKRLKGGS